MDQEGTRRQRGRSVIESVRKYWFMIFLVAVFVACILALIVPSWERDIAKMVAVTFACIVGWSLFNRLDRVEGKLDAILKKLDGD